jgi:hypothetical protein
MVPSGYWTKSKITNLAKTWDAPRKEIQEVDAEKEEYRSARILPAEYEIGLG